MYIHKKVKIILSLSFLILFAAGCSTQESNNGKGAGEAADPKSSGEVNISMSLMGGAKTPDSWVEQALEEHLSEKLGKTVSINPVFYPDWDQLNTKINLLMSSKDTRPTILWTGDTKEYSKWIQAGAIQELTGALQEHGQEILNYYTKETLFYHTENDGKIYRIPGDVPEAGFMTTILRQDWLDKLGLSVPSTLDEYVEVLRAFTHNDPDGNNKNDTYGLSGDNYYRSLTPFFYAFGVDPDQFMKQEDGTVKWGAVMPQAKEALAIIQQLYKEGVIDPRMTTSANSADSKVNEIFASGKVGSMYRFVDYFNPSNVATQAFTKQVPGGQYISIDPVKGKDGFASDLPDPQIGWCYTVITDPAKVEDSVRILNDMLKPETYQLVAFGKEGEHYNLKDGVLVTNVNPDEGNKLGLGNFDWIATRKDKANIKNTTEVNEIYAKKIETTKPMRDKIVFFKSLDRPEWDRYSEDVKKARDEVFWGIITGTQEISAFDSFVKKYDGLGGDKIDREANDHYKLQAEEYKKYESWYEEHIVPYKQ